MVKKGYKETEIGVIPKEWKTISFKECFKTLSNNTLSRAELNDNAGTVKNIHYGDILIKYNSILDCSNEKIPYINKPSQNVFSMLLEDGDLIIADTAEDETVGKAVEITGINNQKVVSGLHTMPCRSLFNNMFSSGWLGYYINGAAYHNQLLPFVTGTKVSAISKTAIANTVILIPPLDEQKRIAEALSDMDKLISSLENLIKKKKVIKEVCLQKMFPKEGETVPEMRLPGFTEPWEQRKLGEFADIVTGKLDANAMKEDGEYVFYTSGIQKYKIDVPAFEGPAITIAGNGATVGYMHLADGKFNAYQRTYVLSAFQANREFLFYEIGNKLPTKIAQEARTGNIPYIVMDMLTDLQISIPSEQEQSRIGEFMMNLDNLITLHQCKLEKCRKIKQGMMQQLLTGKIRLVSNNDVVTYKPRVDTLKVSPKGHNHQFDDAVVIAGIVDKFYSDKYPLGRKKVQKLLYLFRRHQEADTSAFKKKAAGPYADEVRYKGSEPIAQNKKYISISRNSKGALFNKGINIADALNYIEKWGLNDDFDWLLSNFNFTKTDRLELLATIDMAMCDLEDLGIAVSVDNIKNLIKSHKEWKAKLSKKFFSNTDIDWAIKECRRLFNKKGDE